jgi:hypothetical protein
MLMEQFREEIARADKLLLVAEGLCGGDRCLNRTLVKLTLCYPMFCSLPRLSKKKPRVPWRLIGIPDNHMPQEAKER